MRALDRLSRIRDSAGEDLRQRLRDLPCDGQPPYDFTEFRRRSREGRWPKASAVKWEHAAVAAGITVLVASMAMWGRADHHPADMASSGATTAPISQPASESVDSGSDSEALNTRFRKVQQARAVAASKAAQEAVANQFAALARTQGSQRWLDEQPAEPAVVRVGPRFVVASLEDRIAWVDDAMSDAQFAPVDTGRMRTLELQRARLVSSLAQIRYAETIAAQVN